MARYWVMADIALKCPKCQGRRTSEVMRRFKLTHEREGEARGEVHIYWICDYCSHEWDTTTKRRWDSVHGVANRNPSDYRARVDRYAKRVYNRVFDYPPGSFKDDWPGFVALVHEFGGRVCTRYGGAVGRAVARKYTLRAANKLLARWDNPKNLKYELEEAINSYRRGGGEGD